MFPVAKRFVCEHCRKELNLKRYIDQLIDVADGMKYSDFCRLLCVVYWNMGCD